MTLDTRIEPIELTDDELQAVAGGQISIGNVSIGDNAFNSGNNSGNVTIGDNSLNNSLNNSGNTNSFNTNSFNNLV